MRAPSIKALMEHLKLTREQAKAIRTIIHEENPPEGFTYSHYSHWRKNQMNRIDRILGTCGVEYHEYHGSTNREGYWYCNTGDTYALTIICKVKKNGWGVTKYTFFISSWGAQERA